MKAIKYIVAAVAAIALVGCNKTESAKYEDLTPPRTHTSDNKLTLNGKMHCMVSKFFTEKYPEGVEPKKDIVLEYDVDSTTIVAEGDDKFTFQFSKNADNPGEYMNNYSSDKGDLLTLWYTPAGAKLITAKHYFKANGQQMSANMLCTNLD